MSLLVYMMHRPSSGALASRVAQMGQLLSIQPESIDSHIQHTW